MFVKLTLSTNKQPVWACTAHIANLVPNWPSSPETSTHVFTTAGEFEVVETPEEIMALIRHVDLWGVD